MELARFTTKFYLGRGVTWEGCGAAFHFPIRMISSKRCEMPKRRLWICESRVGHVGLLKRNPNKIAVLHLNSAGVFPSNRQNLKKPAGLTCHKSAGSSDKLTNLRQEVSPNFLGYWRLSKGVQNLPEVTTGG